MRLVVFDLFPALLSREGRDAPGEPELRPGGLEAVQSLFSRYRLAGLADSDRPGTEIRELLDRWRLGGYFESVGTAADFGPAVSPRVVRRLASTVGVSARQVVVVTARRPLAEALRRAGLAAIDVGGSMDLADLPETIDAMNRSRLTP